MDRSLPRSIATPSREASPEIQAGLSPELPAVPRALEVVVEAPSPAPEPVFKPAPLQRPVISVPEGEGVRMDPEAVKKALDRAMEFRSKVPFELDASQPGRVLVTPSEGHPWSEHQARFFSETLTDAYGAVSPLGQGFQVTASLEGARDAARDRDILLRRKELWISMKSATFETPEGTRSRNSPWGQIDYATWLGPGVINVGTPGHGGLILSPEANKEIPKALRISTRAYEEDCEWARVACAMPDLFVASDVRSAHRTMKTWEPDDYAAWTGQPVPIGESHILQQRKAREDFKNAYVTVSAISGRKWGAPDGQVLVTASLGGRMENGCFPPDTRSFLVPTNEYDTQKSPIGFVIDSERHPEVKVASDYIAWLPREEMSLLLEKVFKGDELYPNLAAKVEKGMEALNGLGWYGDLEGREAQRFKEMVTALIEHRFLWQEPQSKKKTLAAITAGQTTVRLVANA